MVSTRGAFARASRMAMFPVDSLDGVIFGRIPGQQGSLPASGRQQPFDGVSEILDRAAAVEFHRGATT
jgi:hypothetical protein